jgi:hypothetical protein
MSNLQISGALRFPGWISSSRGRDFIAFVVDFADNSERKSAAGVSLAAGGLLPADHEGPCGVRRGEVGVAGLDDD